MNIEGLSLDQMRVALAVQESGSFASAAKRFGRAQSAVSYAISTLETQLGVSLFDRSGHRALPAPQSMMLLREMAMIVARCDGLRSTADALSRGTEPVVRIVIDQLFDVAKVATALAEFHSLFPATRVEIKTECMEAVVRQVESGFDLGVLASLATVPAHIASKSIRPIRLFPMAAAGWTSARGYNDIDSLRGEGVQIVLSARDERASGADFLVFSTRTWRVEDIGSKLELLRAGVGWGYLPEHLVEADLAAHRLEKVAASGLPAEDNQPVFVVWHQSRPLGPAAGWMSQRLEQFSS